MFVETSGVGAAAAILMETNLLTYSYLPEIIGESEKPCGYNATGLVNTGGVIIEDATIMGTLVGGVRGLEWRCRGMKGMSRSRGRYQEERRGREHRPSSEPPGVGLIHNLVLDTLLPHCWVEIHDGNIALIEMNVIEQKEKKVGKEIHPPVDNVEVDRPHIHNHNCLGPQQEALDALHKVGESMQPILGR